MQSWTDKSMDGPALPAPEYLGPNVIKTGAVNGLNNRENPCEWQTTGTLRIFISDMVLMLVNIFQLILY